MLKRTYIEEAAGFAAKPNPTRNFLLLGAVCAGAWMTLLTPTVLAQAGAPATAPAAADKGRSADRVLAFDVATIKPTVGQPRGTGIWYRPGGIEATNQNLTSLIQYAYGYKLFPMTSQITGLPGWATSQTYDIQAKMSADDNAEFQKLDKAAQQQWREAMMRTLLADRFQLKIERGTKPAPIYELVVAKGGPKMKDAASDPNPPLGKNADGTVPTRAHDLADTRVMQAFSMESLASLLAAPMTGLGRPVVDKTGLTGSYTFNFDWSVYSADTHRSQAGSDGLVWDSPSAIFHALGEIGLKLQPATGTLDTIVVEHVERPSEN